ncbi:unnamed protein product, partial [Pylaiella littoralis]
LRPQTLLSDHRDSSPTLHPGASELLRRNRRLSPFLCVIVHQTKRERSPTTAAAELDAGCSEQQQLASTTTRRESQEQHDLHHRKHRHHPMLLCFLSIEGWPCHRSYRCPSRGTFSGVRSSSSSSDGKIGQTSTAVTPLI